MSTALTHLDPSRHRLNLTIRADVLVRRILFRGDRAVGVEMRSGGEIFSLEGDKIVLSAGAIASPQLLLLSGVGPAAHLESLSIPVVHDLPGVGQNLRDHPQLRGPMEVYDDFPLDPQAPRTEVALRYTAQGSQARNDMLIMILSFSPPIGRNLLEAEGIRFTCLLQQAESSGELTLVSTDSQVQPRLNYRFLEDPSDREKLRESVRICAKLLEHGSFKDIVKAIVEPNKKELASDDALDRWMLRKIATSNHISGTCKMGPARDPGAVVDQYCRVHNLQGLRVADASVMPNVVRANTNATTVMIADRVAQWITEAR